MIKRVNFTGRRRIPRNRVQIDLFDGQSRTFHAAIDLAGMSLPVDAEVILEATSAGSTVVQRYEFGKVSHIEPLQPCALDELEAENVFFALKVVDRSEQVGRILGLAENIRAKKAGEKTDRGRRGILPIQPASIGPRLWKLEEHGGDMHLLVNQDIPGLKDRAASDPQFIACVYPEVVRQVLLKAIEQRDDADDADENWSSLWLRFGQELHPDRQAPPKAGDTEDERCDWVDSVVDVFCERHALKEKYCSAIVASEGTD